MQLEAGMVIYSRDFDGIRRYIITRVTPKQAVVVVKSAVNEYELRFDKELKEVPNHPGEYHGFYAKGSTGYNPVRYYIETDELKALYYRGVLERRFSKIDVKKLSVEDLEAILAILHIAEKVKES